MNTIAVLLVEDNLADVMLLTELLQDSDAEYWEVIHAHRLSSALEQLQTCEFDVILLDLSLPDSQGLDTVVQVQRTAPHIPIVVLSGLQDTKIARQAVAQGAQDYLVKGQISPELLVKAVGYAIERAQNLKKLQDSEHRFRGVFNQTFQFMSLLSPEGVILDVNQVTREVIGFLDEAVINIPIWEALACQSIEQSRVWLKEAVLRAAQGEMVRSELQIRTTQGTLLWLDFSLKSLKNEQDNVVLLIAEGRDISKLKQAEAEIRQALATEQQLNQMKNSFISMVSHEFRNPISVISYAIDVLEDCDLPIDQEKEYYGRIRHAIDQTIELLDEILLLGRTEAGRIEVTYTPIDLKDFCDEIVDSFQLTQGKSHQILFTSVGNFSQVQMDPSLLRHILDNLLSNAIKYSDPGSNILFTLTCQDHQVTLCIQDHGIGIPLKDQEKLFEAFHRARNVGNVQGTGLGLAIVKRCVDLLQGQVQIASQEGVGTTFTVTLPLTFTAAEQERSSKPDSQLTN